MQNLRRPALIALFAASGFAGLIYESIWTHYLKLFLGHAAYAQTLVLAIFMGGLRSARGCPAGGRRVGAICSSRTRRRKRQSACSASHSTTFSWERRAWRTSTCCRASPVPPQR